MSHQYYMSDHKQSSNTPHSHAASRRHQQYLETVMSQAILGVLKLQYDSARTPVTLDYLVTHLALPHDTGYLQHGKPHITRQHVIDALRVLNSIGVVDVTDGFRMCSLTTSGNSQLANTASSADRVIGSSPGGRAL